MRQPLNTLTWSLVVMVAFGCKPAAPSAGGSAHASATEPTPSAPAQSPPEAQASPDSVARRYLELGGRGDVTAARALVVTDCQSGPLGDVDAVKMMGARMTVTSVETTVQSQTANEARVQYTLLGSVHSDGGTTTILGAQVHMQGLNIEGARLGGTLRLVKQPDGWRVTCH